MCDPSERARRQNIFGSGAVAVGDGVHLSDMGAPEQHLRLRVTRRDEPDLDRLMEWVLNIAEARHRAYLNGEPDPYGLPPPDDLPPSASTAAR